MEEQECKNCGKKFIAYKSNHRLYCSKECAMKKNWEKREKGKRVKIICWNCKKEFELRACETRVKENKVHYCSAKCRDEARRTGKIVKCKNCGKEFYTTRTELCSHKCAREYISKNKEHKLYMENGYLIKFKKDYNKKRECKIT